MANSSETDRSGNNRKFVAIGRKILVLVKLMALTIYAKAGLPRPRSRTLPQGQGQGLRSLTRPCSYKLRPFVNNRFQNNTACSACFYEITETRRKCHRTIANDPTFKHLTWQCILSAPPQFASHLGKVIATRVHYISKLPVHANFPRTVSRVS